MKTTIATTAILMMISAPAFAQYADHHVNGYTTNRGTYVEPHYQTNPNSTRLDNYETRGNYNPHTGAYGTRSPY